MAGMNKLSRVQTVVLFIAVLALGTGIGMLIGARVSSHTSTDVPRTIVDASSSDLAPSTPVLINVYVTGAVMRPDVYSLPTGSIVKDALTIAGGSTKDADLVAVNLAAKLQDGDQVTVPVKTIGESTAAASPGSSTSGTHARISINRATLAELDSLPGIGPAKAQAIIDYRTQHGQFKRLEDLQNVKGIGSATFENLKLLITL
jgi:competence protein ComEA